MKKVPKRRFKGFLNAGDWEQRKLISCIQKVIDFRGRTPNKLGMEWSCSGHLALSALNVKDGYIDFSQDNHYGDNDLYEKWMTGNELHKGQVVFTTEAPMGNVAQIPDNERYILSQRTVAFCVDENIITENFLAVLLRTPVIFKTLTKLSSGGTAQGISQKSLAEIEVRIPPNLHEQQIISNFLLSFEHCITLHQRKLEKLQATKKALLYELFPIENSRRPKLRFKGFTGDWEQRKLGEIFEYLQNNTLSRDSLNYKNPNVKNIHYGDILVKFDEILDGSNKDIPYINSEVDLSKFSKSLLRDGDIIFSDTAEDDTVGKAIELQNVNAPFILSGLHTIPCRPLIPFGKGYLGNFLNSDSYRLQLRPLVQGIKVSSISKSALKDTMIEYPKNLDEQEKIGSLFYYIAKMITLHQEESFLHKYML